MNKFRKDERGSSLVMTIIAATFIFPVGSSGYFDDGNQY